MDIETCIPALLSSAWLLHGSNRDVLEHIPFWLQTLRSYAQAKAQFVLQPLLQFLREHSHKLLAESVRAFGSHEYGLPLATSDVDVQITLVPGRCLADGMVELWDVVHTEPDLCTCLPKTLPKHSWDTLSFKFAGGDVDVRIIDCAQADDNKSTLCLRDMVLAQPQEVQDALLLWKLLAHDCGLCHVHGTAKADNFKSITLMYFGIAVCDGLRSSVQAASAGKTRTAWYLACILEVFRRFDFSSYDLFIPSDGPAYFAEAFERTCFINGAERNQRGCLRDNRHRQCSTSRPTESIF